MVHVSVKWGKQSHDVDVDTTMPGLVFKNQLYSLTGVPPDRQKIMVKGGMLQDDADLSKLNLKPKQKLMMMGTADKVNIPHHHGFQVLSSKRASWFSSKMPVDIFPRKLLSPKAASLCSFLMHPHTRLSSWKTCLRRSRMSLAMPSMAQVSFASSSEACTKALQVTELAGVWVQTACHLRSCQNRAWHEKRAIAGVCPRTTN